MTRFLAPIGPGWAQQDGPAHILSEWPQVGMKRWRTFCGSIRIRGRVTTVWGYTFQPEDPCRDCDRAIQVQRIRWILGRLG